MIFSNDSEAKQTLVVSHEVVKGKMKLVCGIKRYLGVGFGESDHKGMYSVAERSRVRYPMR
jgi:hypothetical protein